MILTGVKPLPICGRVRNTNWIFVDAANQLMQNSECYQFPVNENREYYEGPCDSWTTLEIEVTNISSILLSRGKSRQHKAFNVIPWVIFEYMRIILTIDGLGTGFGSKATKFLTKNQIHRLNINLIQTEFNYFYQRQTCTLVPVPYLLTIFVNSVYTYKHYYI